MVHIFCVYATHILERKKITRIFLFGMFMSKEKSAGNDLIWKALLMHGRCFIAKLLKFVFFIHA